jgi:hypothetical protein
MRVSGPTLQAAFCPGMTSGLCLIHPLLLTSARELPNDKQDIYDDNQLHSD